MAASAEADTIAKEICKSISASSTAKNIGSYASEILPHHPNITSIEISIPRYGIKTTPWAGWTDKNSPSWWAANNNIKHDRANKFHEANLENAILAASGLLLQAEGWRQVADKRIRWPKASLCSE